MATCIGTAPGEADAEAFFDTMCVTVFGGELLDNDWDETFYDPGSIVFEDSYLVGAALAAPFWQPVDGLSFELEGQLVRHFGEQQHWEVNAPIVTARWSEFPWTERLDTSVAFGLGVSFASDTPKLEEENKGGTEPVLAYWMIEVDRETPVENWRLVGRIHHRSTAFGLFGERGGSNALVLGLRRQL